MRKNTNQKLIFFKRHENSFQSMLTLITNIILKQIDYLLASKYNRLYLELRLDAPKNNLIPKTDCLFTVALNDMT